MEWYSGGVAAAIASCREKNALFIVYVYDESPDSKNTDESWKSSEVFELLKGNSYVALKVVKDSLEYRQFSQLFAVFMFPTVFCIGKTGQSLVIMNGAQSAAQLKDKLSEGFEKYQDGTNDHGSSISAATPSATPLEPVTTPTSSSSSSSSGASGTSTSSEQKSKEEKVKYAQEKIKERRAEKEESEFEHEKEQELGRREQGRNVAKFKQQQEEQRTQTWLKERKKQKEDARLAREEIRAKLEQDKLERQAQKAAELRQRSQASSPGVASVLSSVTTSSTCRIQLKLPSGGNTVLQLNRTDSLEVLKDTAAKELGVRVSDLVLTSVYPRRELSSDMDSQSMGELQLAPSGVVMVRINRGMASSLKPSGDGGGVMGVLMSLLQLIVSFLTFIKNAIAGVFSSGTQPSSNNQSSESPAERQRERSSGGGSEGVGGVRVRKFRQEDYQEDSDEDRSTYNGNSTQQQ